jgi:hypothetical protein
MTYTELIKQNGASTTAKALEQRARRMAARKGLYVSKFRGSGHFAGNDEGYWPAKYWCNERLFKDTAELINYLAEK